MKAKLTTRSVSASKPRSKYYKIWDSALAGFFLRVMPSGVRSFCVYYRHEGRASEYTLGKHGAITVDQARKQARIKLGEIARGIDVQTDKKASIAKSRAKKFRTLGNFIETKYKPLVLTERKTGREIIANLTREFEHLFPRAMVDISPWDIQKWRTEKIKQGLKPATANKKLATLKAVFSKAVEWQIINQHPLRTVKPLKIDSRSKVRYLTDDEEKRLRNALDDREDKIRQQKDLSKQTFADYLRPLILLALNTGMRRGELFDLTWKNVDLRIRSLTIEGIKAKSGHTRHLPLNSEAFGVLLAWRNQTSSKGLVFPNPKTKRRFNNIKTPWEKLRTEARLKDFRFHDVRHSFASRLVMAGVDLNTVRELLGHSDISMALRYSHLSPQHKAEAVALISKTTSLS